MTVEVATLRSTQENGVYQRRAPTPAVVQPIRHRYSRTSFSFFVPTHCAATLFLNSRSFCCACSTNLSTAYPNLSFFPLNCFSLNASRLLPPSPPPFTFTFTFTFAPLLPLAPILDARPSPILPSSSSLRAIRACSRRESLSRWDSTFERREFTSGVREARRADWADWRVGSGRSSKCWVGGDVLQYISRCHASLEKVPLWGKINACCLLKGDTQVGNKRKWKTKHTRCVCSTFARRGKSLTPASRIDMLEDRSAFVDRKDETQDPSGFAAIP